MVSAFPDSEGAQRLRASYNESSEARQLYPMPYQATNPLTIRRCGDRGVSSSDHAPGDDEPAVSVHRWHSITYHDSDA